MSAALAARSVLPSNRPATALFSLACWELGKAHPPSRRTSLQASPFPDPLPEGRSDSSGSAMSRSRTTADSGEGWKGDESGGGCWPPKNPPPECRPHPPHQLRKAQGPGHRGRRMIGTCRSFRSPQKSLSQQTGQPGTRRMPQEQGLASWEQSQEPHALWGPRGRGWKPQDPGPPVLQGC